jgi:hypothetical protein
MKGAHFRAATDRVPLSDRFEFTHPDRTAADHLHLIVDPALLHGFLYDTRVPYFG